MLARRERNRLQEPPNPEQGKGWVWFSLTEHRWGHFSVGTALKGGRSLWAFGRPLHCRQGNGGADEQLLTRNRSKQRTLYDKNSVLSRNIYYRMRYVRTVGKQRTARWRCS